VRFDADAFNLRQLSARDPLSVAAPRHQQAATASLREQLRRASDQE
jgi:hypothetical protein